MTDQEREAVEAMAQFGHSIAKGAPGAWCHLSHAAQEHWRSYMSKLLNNLIALGWRPPEKQE